MGRENAKKMDDKLAGAALVLSILACASVFLLPLIVPFMLAGTALTLALISRGYGARMPRKAEIAAGFCVVAIIGNILYSALAVGAFVLQYQNSPIFREEMNEQFERIYGMDLEEYIKGFQENILQGGQNL